MAEGHREGVPGMGTGLEVEVLCGASWRQPRVGGNCTQVRRRDADGLAPRGRVGKKPETNRSTERAVNPSAGRADRVSVPSNATPKIQPRSER